MDTAEFLPSGDSEGIMGGVVILEAAFQFLMVPLGQAGTDLDLGLFF